MKKLKTIGLATVCALAFSNLQAQKLPAFNSSVTKRVGPKTITLPYTDVTSYLGYAEKGAEDEVKEGKNYYYLYVWIPAVAPEIGVRMMSPVGNTTVKNATKSTGYVTNNNSKDFFDTYITLERSSIVTASGISDQAVKNAIWFTLATNDDSNQMPKNPNGSYQNSYLQYKSDVNDPKKALTVGLYRIGFTTYKTGDVSGTFLAQLGSVVKLPGVCVAESIDQLVIKLNK